MSVSVTRAMLRDLSPAQAAARWQILFDAEGRSRQVFEEWLDASEENGAAWAALDHAWSQFEDADDAIFADVRAEALSALVSARARPLRPWHIGAVAGLAVAVIGGVLLLPRPTSTPVQVAGADQLYQTGQDGRGITLADGSRITLSPNSRIRVAMEGGIERPRLNRACRLFGAA
jgi:ferric-dicitrate binding protein FerR (iron transport regulator)